MSSIGPVRAFVGLTWNRRLTSELPDELSVVSYGGLGELRRLARLEVVPCHYGALPRLFAERRLPCDVGFVQVSPPDSAGNCSLGVGVDYIADALDHTPVLIAEINRRMPRHTRRTTNSVVAVRCGDGNRPAVARRAGP